MCELLLAPGPTYHDITQAELKNRKKEKKTPPIFVRTSRQTLWHNPCALVADEFNTALGISAANSNSNSTTISTTTTTSDMVCDEAASKHTFLVSSSHRLAAQAEGVQYVWYDMQMAISRFQLAAFSSTSSF